LSQTDLLLRVPQRVRLEDGRWIDTIDEHNRIARERGQVVLAKFGERLGRPTMRTLQDQILGGNVPDLYVTIKRDGVFESYRSPISSVIEEKLPPKLEELVPSYYAEVGMNVGAWFVLKGALCEASLGAVRHQSTGRPITDVIQATRSAALLVESR
jgi:hypothetical protein